MPYTVEQLFKDRENFIPPTGIEQTASIEEALNTMLRKQFSQLPVIDNDNQLVGEFAAYMVTNESILRALRNLNAVPSKLRISDAMVRVRPYRLEDQLSDLLKDLRDTYVVPIMGDKRQFVGVVTSYDTTEYFRKRAEDMMYIERIEKKLQEYILAYFSNATSEEDKNALDAAIADIMPSNKKELRGPFQQAIKYYLELEGDASSSISPALVDKAFEKYLFRKEPPKLFKKLSFDEYIRLFTNEGRWERYKHIFLRESKEMQKLLEDLRDIRNALAHFRIETITDEQRDKILFCEEWLESFHSSVMEEFLPSPSPEFADGMDPTTIPPMTNRSLEDADHPLELVQLEEEKPSDSRYAPLAVWLQEQLKSEQAIKLTFQQIEAIIGDKLPESAHERSWWANDSVGHVQSQQWLEVGWRVSNINMAEETVIFTRMKDRERAYIDFYGGLLPALVKEAQFDVREASPGGQNWIVIARIPSRGPQAAFLGFSFARRGRFRVELYIDTGDKMRNKALFDALEQRKVPIQRDLIGILGSLEWERISDKRASRIALYHKGSITDSPVSLANLSKWAVDSIIKFQKVIDKHLSELV